MIEPKEGETILGGERYVDLSGAFLPLTPEGEPVLIEVSGRWFVPVFSAEDLLETAMQAMGVLAYRAVTITHPDEFFESLRGTGLRIALDPRQVPGEFKTRWTEVYMPEARD